MRMRLSQAMIWTALQTVLGTAILLKPHIPNTPICLCDRLTPGQNHKQVGCLTALPYQRKELIEALSPMLYFKKLTPHPTPKHTHTPLALPGTTNRQTAATQLQSAENSNSALCLQDQGHAERCVLEGMSSPTT